MAEFSDISATSYTLTLGSQSKISCYAIEDSLGSSSNLERKTYCAIFINKFRVVTCIDSGSDLTVMQQNLFKAIFPNNYAKIMKNSNLECIKSFSSNSIKVNGQAKVWVGFSRYGKLLPINLTIIEDIDGVPTFL